MSMVYLARSFLMMEQEIHIIYWMIWYMNMIQ